MNLFTTICVTRLRRDSGKERHYQASYSPPAGYALFQHSRAKRITRSLKENAAPPFASSLGPGTVGLWPEMERKKADCRARWKTFKPWLLARGKQKRPGWRFPAAARSPGRPRSPAGGGQGPEGAPGGRAGRSPLSPPRTLARGPLWASCCCKKTSTAGSCQPVTGQASRHTAITAAGAEKPGILCFWYRRNKRHSLARSRRTGDQLRLPPLPAPNQTPRSLKTHIMGSCLYHLLRASQLCRMFPWRLHVLRTKCNSHSSQPKRWETGFLVQWQQSGVFNF